MRRHDRSLAGLWPCSCDHATPRAANAAQRNGRTPLRENQNNRCARTLVPRDRETLPTRLRAAQMQKQCSGVGWPLRRSGHVKQRGRALGLNGVLVRMAERGQLLDLCEMLQCYDNTRRGAFDPVTTPTTKWAPSSGHYPILKSAGGHLVPENVRLSHTWCSNRDYGWRTQVRTLARERQVLRRDRRRPEQQGCPPGPR